MLQEQTFDTGVVSINYVAGPAGGRALVLLHGVTGRWQTWLSAGASSRWTCAAMAGQGTCPARTGSPITPTT